MSARRRWILRKTAKAGFFKERDVYLEGITRQMEEEKKSRLASEAPVRCEYDLV